MSCDCDKPTLTFPSGAYNATQVRLYGIVQNTYAVSANDPKKRISSDGKIVTTVAVSEKFKDNAMPYSEIDKLRKAKLPEEEIFHQLSKDEKATSLYYTSIIFDLKKKISGNVDIYAVYNDKENPISCGIIVGYAYEGHCYDLPKPKIMLIPAMPEMIPIDDCGYREKYDKNSNDKYMLWIVDKLDECVEFEMNQGFVEQIVLEANLPGKRSPTMYASRMMMGHRGGRLGE